MSGVTLLRITSGITWTQPYIYIYIYTHVIFIFIFTLSKLIQYKKTRSLV